jgi:hypothetical protein
VASLPERGLGWADLDADGTVNVFRRDGSVYYRLASFEGFDSGATWVEIKLSSGDPPGQLAADSSLLAAAVRPLLSETVEDLVGHLSAQVAAADGNPGQVDPDVLGLEPDDPKVMIRWDEDDSGELETVEIWLDHPEEPMPGHSGHLGGTFDVLGPRPLPVDPVTGGDVISYGDLLAADHVLNSHDFFACRDVDEDCVRSTLGDLTVGQWIEEPPGVGPSPLGYGSLVEPCLGPRW